MPVGKNHHLIFQPKFNQDTVKTIVKNYKIVVSYPASFNPQDQLVQAAAQNAIIKALKAEAEEYLPRRLNALSVSSGLAFSECKLRNMKRKWGSCNQNKVITLNIWLMTLPNNLIDYVLLHELTHTRHMNHQPGFWDSLAKSCPDYKTLRMQLKKSKTLLGEEAQPVR
jgi:predicted metal-dependent hydrolase